MHLHERFPPLVFTIYTYIKYLLHQIKSIFDKYIIVKLMTLSTEKTSKRQNAMLISHTNKNLLSQLANL